MMLNLSLLRKEQHPQEIYDFINEHKTSLLLPDQDILNALYADRTIFLDPLIYNLGEKYLRLKICTFQRKRNLESTGSAITLPLCTIMEETSPGKKVITENSAFSIRNFSAIWKAFPKNLLSYLACTENFMVS